MGTGPNLPLRAIAAAESAGRDLVIAGFDISPDMIAAIEAGDVAFTVDQQQYLQGYLPVVLMYLQATNLNTAGGGLPILTGPGFVDAENVAERRGAGRGRHPLTHSIRRWPDRPAAAPGRGSRDHRPEASPMATVTGCEGSMTDRHEPALDAAADERLALPRADPATAGAPEIGALVGTTAVWVFFWAVADAFGTAAGTANYLDVAAPLGIMAVAVVAADDRRRVRPVVGVDDRRHRRCSSILLSK